MFDKTRRVSVLHRWLALIDTFLTSRYTADQSAHVTLDNKSLWSIALVITFNKLYLFSCEVANNFIEAFVFAAGSLTCKLHFSKQRRFERLLLRAFSLKAFFSFIRSAAFCWFTGRAMENFAVSPHTAKRNYKDNGFVCKLI